MASEDDTGTSYGSSKMANDAGVNSDIAPATNRQHRSRSRDQLAAIKTKGKIQSHEKSAAGNRVHQICSSCASLEKNLARTEQLQQTQQKCLQIQAEEKPPISEKRRIIAPREVQSVRTSDEKVKSKQQLSKWRRHDDVVNRSMETLPSSSNDSMRGASTNFQLSGVSTGSQKPSERVEVKASSKPSHKSEPSSGQQDSQQAENRGQCRKSQKRRSNKSPKPPPSKRAKRRNASKGNRKKTSSEPGKNVTFAKPISIVHTINRPESKRTPSAVVSACASNTCLIQSGTAPVPTCQEKGEALLPTWGFSAEELMPEHLDRIFNETERKFRELGSPCPEWQEYLEHNSASRASRHCDVRTQPVTCACNSALLCCYDTDDEYFRDSHCHSGCFEPLSTVQCTCNKQRLHS